MAASGTAKMVFTVSSRGFISDLDVESGFYGVISHSFPSRKNVVVAPIVINTVRSIFTENSESTFIPPVVVSATRALSTNDLKRASLIKPIVVSTTWTFLAL
jgi:hypothetical protein